MRRFLMAMVACAAMLLPAAAFAQDAPRSVVLVTIDGFRWQELFRGADPSLVTDPAYRVRYVDVPDRGDALVPFVRSFAQQGALIGDRDHGSCAHVTNDFWFSYPGYAEILEGHPNPHIRRNHAGPNPEVTVLERLLQRPEFADQVHVYAAWNEMPNIVNTERSHIPVFNPPDPSAPEDAQVMAKAREIFGNLPRITWLAFGDTDSRAHEGKYNDYLDAAHAADAFLRDLWSAIQADPRTADHTTMIVTADHGRGPSAHGGWRGHGSGRWQSIVVPGLRKEGSDQVFIAARGPGIVSTDAYTLQNCATSSQVAATLLHSMGLDSERQPDMGAPLAIFGAAQ